MKILFISKYGDSFGIACYLANHGHDIKFWIEDKASHPIGTNFKNPERIKFYEPVLNKQDIIIFDMSGMGDIADKMQKKGLPILGGAKIADKLEHDRLYAHDIVKKYAPDLTLPRYKEFNSLQKGIDFLKGEKDALWCFKPDKSEPHWTYIPRKRNDGVMTAMQNFPKKNHPFILQEMVNGIEISTEGWIDANGELIACNHTMEEKRLFPKGWGPNVGCAGSVVWKCGNDRLVETAIMPFVDFLHKNGFVGGFDVNTIIDGETVYFLEFTPRFGYDAIENWLVLADDPAEFLRCIATGDAFKGYISDDLWSMAVRMTYPPYPLSEADEEIYKRFKGMKVLSIPRYLSDNVFLMDTMLNEDKEPVMSGCHNVVAVVLTTGETIDDCREFIYEDEGILDSICLTNDLQISDEIGKGCMHEICKLMESGMIDSYPESEHNEIKEERDEDGGYDEQTEEESPANDL